MRLQGHAGPARRPDKADRETRETGRRYESRIPNPESRSARGFTLVELIVVMAIIALLAGIAVPASRHIMARSREAVLRHNLAQMREMIDQYYADKQKYPEQLSDLVSEGGYFRRIPKDPITGKDDWEVVKLSDVAEEDDLGQGESEEDGIWDIHSKAEGKGLDGTPYKEW